MKDILVQLHPAEKTLRVQPGAAFRQIAESAGAEFRMPCGGKGRCGKCKVIFQEGAPAPTPAELAMLTEAELAQGYRLGCMTVLRENAVVHMPNGSTAAKILTAGAARNVPVCPCITKKHVQIPEPTVADLRSDLKRVLDALDIVPGECEFDLSVLRRLGQDIRGAGFDITIVLANGSPISIEAGDTTGECFGVALDVGTTTLAAYLLDLNSGKQVSVAADINPQSRVGDDVISRIAYTMQQAGGLDNLRMAVVRRFNDLLKTLSDDAGVPLDRIYEVSLVGNTCMTHLFLGIDPKSLAQAPYVPVVSQSLSFTARELDVEINPCGRVHILPCIAGYVGADTVGVILSTGLCEDERLTLAIDIGTNGEIVLGSKEQILACSTAAGPAFEGSHIKHGMRAGPGAIDSAWLDEQGIRFSTVDGAKAAGICGSGLLDVIICLVNAGIVEPSGRIVGSDEVPEAYAHMHSRVRAGEFGNEFVLAHADETSIGEPVVIVQRDVREVQLAKGAIAAGIRTLMDRLGVGVDDLDRVVLAGAFGNYIRKQSAIAAGMLPAVPVEKVHGVGNAAGEGAKLSLISSTAREEADRIAARVKYVELTTDLGFQERFAEALMFGGESKF